MNLRADSIHPVAKSWIAWIGAIATVVSLALGIRACDSGSAKAAQDVVAAHDDSESSHPRLRVQVETNRQRGADHELRLRAIERRDEVLGEILEAVRELREEDRTDPQEREPS